METRWRHQSGSVNAEKMNMNGFIFVCRPRREEGVLPEKLGEGVQPASQNPYPIYDQNLRYSLPYLWPDL